MTFDPAEVEAVIRAELVKQGGIHDGGDEPVWFVDWDGGWDIQTAPIAIAVLSWLRDQGAVS